MWIKPLGLIYREYTREGSRVRYRRACVPGICKLIYGISCLPVRPQLRVKSAEELADEEARHAARPSVTGANAATIYVDDKKGSAKRCKFYIVLNRMYSYQSDTL